MRGGLPSSWILTGNIGLLVEGRSDADAIEGKRGDGFSAKAPGLDGVASAACASQIYSSPDVRSRKAPKYLTKSKHYWRRQVYNCYTKQ